MRVKKRRVKKSIYVMDCTYVPYRFFIASIICGTYLFIFVLNSYDVCAYCRTEQYIVPVYLAGTLVPVTMLFERTSKAQFGPAPSPLLEFKDLSKNKTPRSADIKKIGNKRGFYGFVNSVNGQLYIGSTYNMSRVREKELCNIFLVISQI